MLYQAQARLPAQIQAHKFRVFLFQLIHNNQGLGVMVKTAMIRKQPVQGLLTRMPKGRVTKIMSERNCLGQVLVKAQGPGNGSGNTRHLNGVGQAGAEMIVPLARYKYLGLVLQSTKGMTVYHPVPVTLKIRPQ